MGIEKTKKNSNSNTNTNSNTIKTNNIKIIVRSNVRKINSPPYQNLQGCNLAGGKHPQDE